MKLTRAERRLLAEVKPIIERFRFMRDAVVEKILEDNRAGLKNDCLAAVPLLAQYKLAWNRLNRMYDNWEPASRKERKEALRFGHALLVVMIFGGALGKSPKQIRKSLGSAAEQVLASRAKHQDITIQ